ncbi:MAG: ribosome silencing factor [Bacteroidales bacterium]|nr:ribosome silencing factor [Bacteroidales bacterium]MCF8458514.1 ribosome silencing factor [Bacteroidales bacterium]
MNKITDETKQLVETIVNALHEKKALDVVSIRLADLKDPICDYFIICHGDSNPHVQALAESAIDEVREKLNTRVWKKEGFENGQWLLLDYVNVVVHVFQTEWRNFYNLEGLWADAEIQKHVDEGSK